MANSTTKQKEKESDIDFESLLLKKESKEKLINSNWTKCILKDVDIYKKYTFAKKRDLNKDSSALITDVIGGGDSPEEVYNNFIHNPEELYYKKYSSADSMISRDGHITHGNEEIVYDKETQIVVTVETPDESYSEKYAYNTRLLECTDGKNYDRLSNMVGESVEIINDSGDIWIRPIKKSDSTISEIFRSKQFKHIITALPLFSLLAYFILFVLSLPAMINFAGTYLAIIPILFVALMSLFVGLFISDTIYKKAYKNLYTFSDSINVSEFPESAKITEEYKEEKPQVTDANCVIENSGTIKITSEGKTWTFENEDGIPSDEAENIYRFYGGDLDNETTLKVELSEYSGQKIKDNMYVSDSEEWVLRLIY